MVTKDSKPRKRSTKNKGANQSDGIVELAGIQSRQTTSDKIEEQRGRLMLADSLLHCAVIVMEEDVDDGTQGPYIPGVISQARELINDAIRELETLELECAANGRTQYEVKEEPPEYAH